MTLALLCSGQGGQSADMFALTANEPDAEEIFDAAGSLLGRDPRILVREEHPETLQRNRVSQILCVTQAFAAYAAIAAAVTVPAIVAGYSVGEMTAWSVAGVWEPQELLRLVDARARCMDAADSGDTGLGYVRGLSDAEVARLAAMHGCVPAILSPQDVVVFGGPRSELDHICAAARAAGAVSAGVLSVRIASHTALLSAAVPMFREIVAAAPMRPIRPGWTLLCGSGGNPVFRPEQAGNILSAQLAQLLDWRACVTALRERGARRFLELGPGGALARMFAGSPEYRTASFDQFRSIDGVRNWLGSTLPT